MRGDLSVIGPQAAIRRRLTTSGTAVEQGEPVDNQASSSSGAANANVYALSNADGPIVGTDRWGGIAIKQALLVAAGTTQAQEIPCACPIPGVGRVRGLAETAANVDTDAELLAVTGDFVLFDNTDTTGASDGGELFTIKSVASADTSGLEIVGGNPALSQLDVTVAPTVYRFDVT